jgi:cystathionine beta-synthase
MYHKTILDLIGHTPLVRINTFHKNPRVTLVAKLEYMNPGGSVKDRIGPAMIDRAEKMGKLKKGGTIVEPTSGNTGTGLAMVAAVRGYKTVFVMPDKMSDEKRNLLRAYGAKVVITPTAVLARDERSYYKVSDRLATEIENAYKPDQYHNPANPEIHYKTTGPEIWEQTEGNITHLVCGMGTGGTITGVGKYLKEKNPKIKVIGVDPEGSVFTQYKKTGKFPDVMKTYKVEGVGEDFIPSTIDFDYIDDVIQVGDRECFETARRLAREEGILVGGSSGMALYAAAKVCAKVQKGLVVVIFPDSGKSYLSKMYSDDWMRENGFLSPDDRHGVILDVLAAKRGRKMVTIGPKDTVKKAIQIMKEKDISQMPVIDGEKVLGKVTERHLLTGLYQKSIGPTNHIAATIDPHILTVDAQESVDHVSRMLEEDNLVVVLDKAGTPLGVVTRIDLIDYYM